MASRRILSELKEFEKTPITGCHVVPGSFEDIYQWKATIAGPTDSPYAGGVFNVSIQFSSSYPFKPPVVHFVTKIYHPNINSKGEICLDILKEKWNPGLTISKVLLSICSLLCAPTPEDSVMPEIASMFMNDRAKFEEISRSWTETYAMN